MISAKEDKEYLKIEKLQQFLNDGGYLVIDCWNYLENGDNSNTEPHETRILAKGDNIEEILEKKLYYIFRSRYQYRNSKYIIFNNAIEIVPLKLNEEEKEDIKKHNFDRDYIYNEYYGNRDYDDYKNNLILNFYEDFEIMFKTEKRWLGNIELDFIKYWKNDPESHADVVYCVCELLEEYNSENIASSKNNYNELKEICNYTLKVLKKSYENVLFGLNESCDNFIKRNCVKYEEITEKLQEYINVIDYITKSNLLDEVIQKIMRD